MKSVSRWLVASMIWGVISLLFFIVERLAMTDIFHGEPDLSLEWSLVSLSFLPILLFHILALVAATLAWRQLKRV